MESFSIEIEKSKIKHGSYKDGTLYIHIKTTKGIFVIAEYRFIGESLGVNIPKRLMMVSLSKWTKKEFIENCENASLTYVCLEGIDLPLTEKSYVVEFILEGTIRSIIGINNLLELEYQSPDWLWKAQAYSVVPHIKCESCGSVDRYGRGPLICTSCGAADGSNLVSNFINVDKEWQKKYRMALDKKIGEEIDFSTGDIILKNGIKQQSIDNVIALLLRIRQAAEEEKLKPELI